MSKVKWECPNCHAGNVVSINTEIAEPLTALCVACVRNSLLKFTVRVDTTAALIHKEQRLIGES